jgi:tetratricopeptide (TPR) repeat protein
MTANLTSLRTVVGATLVAFLLLTPAFGASQKDLADGKGEDADSSIAGCTRVLEDKNESPSNLAVAYVNRGMAWVAGEDFDRAIADFSEAIRLDPKIAHYYYRRGRAWHDKDEFDRAIVDCDEAIQFEPKDDRFYHSRGDAWSGKKDFDRSIADYTEAIRLDPKFALYYFSRGVDWSHKDELDRAIADFSKAIELDPKDADYRNSRGIRWELKGDLEHAMSDYNEAIRIDPKHSRAYSNRGDVWRTKGDLDRAIADYARAILLRPKNDVLFLKRAVTQLYKPAGPAAMADVKRALELDPKDAYNVLWAEIIGQRNKLPSRLTQMISSIDMERWPAPLLRLFLDQSRPEAALAAADHPDSKRKRDRICDANFFGGIWELRQGAKDNAGRLFRLAADECPASNEKFAAAAELKLLGQ